MKHQLFDHQAECIAAVEAAFSAGDNRVMVVLATGAGKTMIYLHLVDQWAKQHKRILILAHRRELIHQPVDRAGDFYPELAKRMGIVMAKSDESQKQVVVATVQTAVRDRLVGDFDYVILDECHHGTSKMYQKMFAAYPDSKWLGLTATPFRHDQASMANIFGKCVYRFPITSAVEKGILVPFDAFGFTLPIEVGGLTATVDGWEEKSLGRLLSADNVMEIVYQKWLEYCKDRQTFIFTASVSQAHATAKYFQDQGIQAAAVDGSTPKKQRDGILRLFKAGKLQVLANCQVFTEGVDVPQASAALMVCPTKSDLAYVQKLGRVLRTHPGKTNAIVLDFAPLDERNIVMAGDVLGIPRIVKEMKEKAKEAGILVKATRVDKLGLAASVDPNALIVEALQYLRKGFLAWSMQDNMTVASLSDSILLCIELPDTNRIANAERLKAGSDWSPKAQRLYDYLLQYKLWIVRRENGPWVAKQKSRFATMEQAHQLTNKLVDAGYLPALAKKRNAWRGRPVSSAQFDYMTRLKIVIPESCTQGQAAQLISHEIATQAILRVQEDHERQIMRGV